MIGEGDERGNGAEVEGVLVMLEVLYLD